MNEWMPLHPSQMNANSIQIPFKFHAHSDGLKTHKTSSVSVCIFFWAGGKTPSNGTRMSLRPSRGSTTLYASGDSEDEDDEEEATKKVYGLPFHSPKISFLRHYFTSRAMTKYMVTFRIPIQYVGKMKFY